MSNALSFPARRHLRPSSGVTTCTIPTGQPPPPRCGGAVLPPPLLRGTSARASFRIPSITRSFLSSLSLRRAPPPPSPPSPRRIPSQRRRLLLQLFRSSPDPPLMLCITTGGATGSSPKLASGARITPFPRYVSVGLESMLCLLSTDMFYPRKGMENNCYATFQSH
jgi:hypothetical protein